MKNWHYILLVIFVILLIIGGILLIKYGCVNREKFTLDSVCAGGLSTIIKRAMNLEDDNTLPDELKTKCIMADDFKKLGDRSLLSNSSVLTVLNNLFQSTTADGKPYIAKYYDWKDSNGNEYDWTRRLESSGTTSFQNTVSLLTNIIIPMIVNLRGIFTDISVSDTLSEKYNLSVNSANKQFINGFLEKYKDFSVSDSPNKLKTVGTEENAMFKSLTDRIDYRDPIIAAYNLQQALKQFALSYLLNVNFGAAAQCNINIMDTQVDNDVKLYIRLKKLFDMWRASGKTGKVEWIVNDLNSSVFQSDNPDYTKDGLMSYFLDELKFRNSNNRPSNISDEAYTVQIINNMINSEFVTDGGVNDGKLREEPGCSGNNDTATPRTVLHCNMKLLKRQQCDPNMDACHSNDDFNKYCTALKTVLDSAADPDAEMPELKLGDLPKSESANEFLGRESSETSSNSSNAGAGGANNTSTTTTSSGGGSANNTSTTTTTSSEGGSSVGGSGLPGSGSVGSVGAPLSAGAVGPDASSNNEPADAALTSKLRQYNIPSYFERSTQELLIFVYEKLAASYNFDDDEVADDIKEAIRELPPAARANLCARYCQLTSRCNGICKFAGCLNCEIGDGSNSGSTVYGESESSLSYAGVDDDYNLLGFLDDISFGGINNEIGGRLVSSYNSWSYNLDGIDTIPYKHMGPVISQKDTSGVSNIFAPYIVMAPKREGSSYGAYLLDDPNDPNYLQYVNDLTKSF